MKKTSNKVNAAIIIIGNEILSGRTQDVNVVHLSKWLNELGVKVEEVRVIPDIENSIVNTVNELRKKFKYVFTTGGIGPTHDDITSRSIAKAFNVSYGYNKDAYETLERYYKTGEPMVNEGAYNTKLLKDGWTAVTKDKSLSAQFEHTVGVTNNGFEIFTRSKKNYEQPPYLI